MKRFVKDVAFYRRPSGTLGMGCRDSGVKTSTQRGRRGTEKAPPHIQTLTLSIHLAVQGRDP